MSGVSESMHPAETAVKSPRLRARCCAVMILAQQSYRYLRWMAVDADDVVYWRWMIQLPYIYRHGIVQR